MKNLFHRLIIVLAILMATDSSLCAALQVRSRILQIQGPFEGGLTSEWGEGSETTLSAILSQDLRDPFKISLLSILIKGRRGEITLADLKKIEMVKRRIEKKNAATGIYYEDGGYLAHFGIKIDLNHIDHSKNPSTLSQIWISGFESKHPLLVKHRNPQDEVPIYNCGTDTYFMSCLMGKIDRGVEHYQRSLLTASRRKPAVFLSHCDRCERPHRIKIIDTIGPSPKSCAKILVRIRDVAA